MSSYEVDRRETRGLCARHATRAGTVAGCVAAVVALGSATRVDDARAQDDSAEARDCVSLGQVDRTKVIDDDTILFYMKDDAVYRNDLPTRCPALEQEDTFMYRVTTSQLCDVDTITVLSDMGFGFNEMATCGLGGFVPIGAATVEELEAEADEPRGRRR